MMMMDVASFRSTYRCLLLAAAAGGALTTAALGDYELTQHIMASDGSSAEEFGIALGGDDDLIIVGAHYDEDNGDAAGSAYIYRFDGTTWVEEQELQASDGQPYDRFGYAVDIQGDIAVVGAAWTDDVANNSGAVYVFRYQPSSGQWVEETKLLAPDGADGDQLGFSLGLSDNVILAGAYSSDHGATNAGAAYVYRYNGFGWTMEHKLTPADPGTNQYFGAAVALSGDVAMIGKYGDSTNGGSAGAAYVFRYTGSTWFQQQKLLAGDGGPSDLFGAAVAASGDVVVAGARHDDETDTNTGAAYVFRFNGSSWVMEQKLVASDGEAWDKFGRAVTVEGDVIAVGAWWDDNGILTDAGSAYAFKYVGGQWVEQANLRDETGWFDDYLGGAMAIAGDAVVCGASNDDNIGNNSGSVFVYLNGAGSDCNGNGISDAQDIAAGTSTDCNGNAVPDECEGLPDCDDDGTPDACEIDCNKNGVPDDCEFLADCNMNGTPDECEFLADCNMNGTPDACESFADCNGNQVPDECEVPGNDCNDNGVPDDCEMADGDCDGNGVLDVCEPFADCNENGIPDTCDIASGASSDAEQDGVPDECQGEDCNANGVEDGLDIAGGFSEDCNGNDVPDECEGTLSDSSGLLSPIGSGSPQSYFLANPPAAIGPVQLSFLAQADLSAPLEYVDVDVNGVPAGRLFEQGGVDCGDPPNSAQIDLSAAEFNALIADGNGLLATMTASAHVSPALCPGGGFILLNITYPIEGLADLDGNGIPDECEGVCTADITGDGRVNVEDIVEVILGWGPCAGPCPADVTGDEEIDVDDLFQVMEEWGCNSAP